VYFHLASKPKSSRGLTLDPLFWACITYILGLVITYFYLPQEKAYIGEVLGGIVPQYSLLPILIYFFAVVVVMGIVLFLVPVWVLKIILRVMFCFFYAWGIFILLYILLGLPWYVALLIGIALGVTWFFLPIIWLQNLLLIITLVSVAAVFGAMIPAWTVVWVLLAISIYDIVAVTVGYMIWMAKKMSQSDSLPAFIFPRNLAFWKLNLRGSTVTKLFDEEASEREFSLLGGGDIGFPLLLVVAVFFGYGRESAFIVAGASFAGIIFAYMLQIFLLKGKPLPALPPISFLSIIGFLIVYYVL
jgi:presenilin-like A22 family membrane protease